MFKKSNRTAKRLAIISGIMLMISGITGVGFIKEIESLVGIFLASNYLLTLIFTILILIASLGGISVIIGGILIGKNKILLGTVFIRIGSGVGVLSLLAHILLSVYTKNLSITSFMSVAGIGTILSVIAPFYAKKR